MLQSADRVGLAKVFEARRNFTNLHDQFVAASGQQADVNLGALGHVTVDRTLHEEFVEGDEERSHDAPEGEDDAQAVRIERIPHVFGVGDHAAEVGQHQDGEQDGEGQVEQEVPPTPNPQVVFTLSLIHI